MGAKQRHLLISRPPQPGGLAQITGMGIAVDGILLLSHKWCIQ